MISLTTESPLVEAVEAMDRRTPVGSVLTSAQWEAVPAEVRDRAFFMARVESERILNAARRRIIQRIRLERDRAGMAADDDRPGRVMDRSRFIEEMQRELEAVGYRPDPEKVGTLEDLGSAGRLRLVWDMNVSMAEGYAGWKTKQDDAVLKTRPAQELIRVENRVRRRDWPLIWSQAGGTFYGAPGPDYPQAPGRMIAPVNDPIWVRISRFGTPWPPFDWYSGMGLKAIRRREAENLGVVTRGEPQQPQQTPFNEGLQASVKGLPDTSRERLRETFGDTAEIAGEDIIYRRDLSEANPHREKTIPQELRARREAFMQASRVAELPAELTGEIERIARVVTGQRLAVTFATLAPAAMEFLRGLLPDEVKVSETDDGQTVVSREGGVA